jgi:hypothetical protein
MQSATTTPSYDPRWPRLTTASIEEIRYAEQLRRQIESRYLAAAEHAHRSGVAPATQGCGSGS